MNYETLFSIANASVIPAWLLLAILPKSKITYWLVYSYFYPIVFGIAYTTLLIAFWGTGDGGLDSLENVRKGFAQDPILLLGWIHYLAFDLFIGSWEVRDAQRMGIPHWWIIIPLFFTLMLGPIGLMLYLVIRGLKTKKWAREAF